jgi:drug/metabolite transporter (DMT)-like permease
MLSWAVGMCIGVGMVFYNLGAVFITAAQMQLLQMTEVVSGTILVLLLKVWAPDKGEVPSVLATVGGLMICGAIAGQGYAMQRQQPPLDGEGNDKGGTESGKDSSANA